jgi:hypothetical protein
MRSEPKTWGPFTGRQLTTIICITIVALLLPVAASSATASHVVVDSGKVTLASQAAANVAQRSQFISSDLKSVPQSGDVMILAPPAGKGLVITTFHVTAFAVSAGSSVHFFFGEPTTCALERFTYDIVFAAGYSTAHETVVPGYVVPPGKALCAHSSGTIGFYTSAYGYIVAPGDARNPQLTTGAGGAEPHFEHP